MVVVQLATEDLAEKLLYRIVSSKRHREGIEDVSFEQWRNMSVSQTGGIRESSDVDAAVSPSASQPTGTMTLPMTPVATNGERHAVRIPASLDTEDVEDSKSKGEESTASLHSATTMSFGGSFGASTIVEGQHLVDALSKLDGRHTNSNSPTSPPLNRSKSLFNVNPHDRKKQFLSKSQSHTFHHSTLSIHSEAKSRRRSLEGVMLSKQQRRSLLVPPLSPINRKALSMDWLPSSDGYHVRARPKRHQFAYAAAEAAASFSFGSDSGDGNDHSQYNTEIENRLEQSIHEKKLDQEFFTNESMSTSIDSEDRIIGEIVEASDSDIERTGSESKGITNDTNDTPIHPLAGGGIAAAAVHPLMYLSRVSQGFVTR